MSEPVRDHADWNRKERALVRELFQRRYLLKDQQGRATEVDGLHGCPPRSPRVP